jgi:hypothetical protein
MSHVRITVPNPGSPEAVAMGCTCPIEINCHGFGMYNGALLNDGRALFTWHEECPVHGLGTGVMSTITEH